MTRNSTMRSVLAARNTKTADQLLAKYRAVGPACLQAALRCAKARQPGSDRGK